MIDDRVPGESAESYRRYALYRDMPASTRSLDLVAEAVGVKPGTIRNLSAKHDWTRRVETWDRDVSDERGRATVAATVESAVDIHSAAANLIYSAIGKAQAIVDGIDPETVTTQQATILRAALTSIPRPTAVEMTVTASARDSVRSDRIAELMSRIGRSE